MGFNCQYTNLQFFDTSLILDLKFSHPNPPYQPKFGFPPSLLLIFQFNTTISRGLGNHQAGTSTTHRYPLSSNTYSDNDCGFSVDDDLLAFISIAPTTTTVSSPTVRTYLSLACGGVPTPVVDAPMSCTAVPSAYFLRLKFPKEKKKKKEKRRKQALQKPMRT